MPDDLAENIGAADQPSAEGSPAASRAEPSASRAEPSTADRSAGARSDLRTRNALLPDAPQIHALIGAYSGDGTLLPRTFAEICENIRDFVVIEHLGAGPASAEYANGEHAATGPAPRIIACGALHLYGPHLTEVRSIAVDPAFNGLGAGRRVVRALLREARRQHVECVCLFTRIPSFFARFGFKVVTREELPDKMYKDCLQCPRVHACDEIAMAIGDIPKFSILQEGSTFFPLIRLQ